MKESIIYLHGKGGSAKEADQYKTLFPNSEVIGFDYRSRTPWEAKEEFPAFFVTQRERSDRLILIANSIGAFFSMHAGIDRMIRKAYFISPIVDMERLILNMMSWANVTEKKLEEKRVIATAFGEDLSWDYLCYVREHPVRWNAPTRILYGSRDNLTAYETVSAFAETYGAELTVMEDGEHWFHTDGQMRFLDDWIRQGEKKLQTVVRMEESG